MRKGRSFPLCYSSSQQAPGRKAHQPPVSPSPNQYGHWMAPHWALEWPNFPKSQEKSITAEWETKSRAIIPSHMTIPLPCPHIFCCQKPMRVTHLDPGGQGHRPPSKSQHTLYIPELSWLWVPGTQDKSWSLFSITQQRCVRTPSCPTALFPNGHLRLREGEVLAGVTQQRRGRTVPQTPDS